jgi:4-amino-4-deoxy-L-arabinose transferase-like glycosyltransferase
MLTLFTKRELFLYVLVVLVTLAGFFLRFYQLDDWPLQVNQDELSNIYDGWSISETGTDRWGSKYPLALRGFGDGDYRPSLYAWLCALSIKFLGPSVFAGRLPAAVLGCLSLLLIFSTARRMGGLKYAFFALLLTALMPWHILYSRMAHEGTFLVPFFLILSIYFFVRCRETGYKLPHLVLLGLATGLGANSSHAAKLVFFMTGILWLTDLAINCRSWKKAVWLASAMLVGALPQLVLLASARGQFASRADNTVLPFSFTYDYINNLFNSLYANFSSSYLFFSFGDYHKHTVGRLLNVECFFLFPGIFFLHRVLKKACPVPPAYFYILSFITIFPASLTLDNPHPIRSSGLIVLLPLLSAAGIMYWGSLIKKQNLQRLYLILIAALLVSNGGYFINKYPGYAGKITARHQNELVVIAEKVNKIKDRYERIVMEDAGNQPYIYFAYYCHIHPADFQKMQKGYWQIADGNWDHFTEIGKYFFLPPEHIPAKISENPVTKKLLITKSLYPGSRLIDTARLEDSKFFFSELN